MAKTPRPATDTGIVIGQILQGKYRVEEILGQGGMGIVARCTHLALNEQVAVKMLRADVLQDQDATARFMREAQAAVKLRSEYVARVSDVGTFDNGVPYMVMEFLDGHDLGALLEEQHHIQPQWAAELILQTCEALAEAHSINIVHRDVKPTNLFVTWRPDGTSLIKVLDFGISKSPMGADMQLTQTQSLLGTPAYMSPEQMRSARLVDARTDIWSLGTVMYELLEGRRPFEAESFSEMCVKVAVDQPSPMINTPPAMQQVVLRCLAKSPEHRYPNMAELGRDLIPFARDPHQAAMLVERMSRMLGRASPVGGWEAPPSRMATPLPVVEATLRERSAPAMMPNAFRRRRRVVPILIGFAVAIAAGAGIAVSLNRADDARDEPKPAVAPAEPPKQPEPKPAAPAVAQPAAAEQEAAELPKQVEIKADELTPAEIQMPTEKVKPKPAKSKPPKVAKKPPLVAPPAAPPVEKTIEPPPPQKFDPKKLYESPRAQK